MSLAAVLLLSAIETQAKSPRSEKKAAKKETADTTKNAKKTVSKYERLFVRDKSCQTTASDFITIHRAKGKLYFEIPLRYMGREMLLASTISEASDIDIASIGYKPSPPMHIKLLKADSTIYMANVSILPDFDGDDAAMSAAMKRASLDPMFNSFTLQCYNRDSTAVVIDVTKTFNGHVESLSPIASRAGSYSMSGTFNASGSVITEAKTFEDNLTVKSLLSYKVKLSYLGMTVIDDQPATFKVTRTLLLLPEKKMRPRVADSRLGIFLTGRSAIGAKDVDKIKKYSVINRWDLQPADTTAFLRGELVEPVEPITFYLDDAFPELWREPVRESFRRWSRAFETIGFKNAIRVVDFPKDDPEFDPDNLKYSCIRYVPSSIANAMGPSWVDPSTGEIINASVIVYNDVVRLLNQWRFVQTAQVDERVRAKKMPDDVLQESLTYVLAHEVGHTLGFMHNMSASAAFRVDSLRSESFTRKYGTTPSIMDYARFNYVAQPSDKGVKLTPPDFGPYDLLLIKYAYRPVPEAATAEEEAKIIEEWVDRHAGDPIYRYGKQQTAVRYDPSAIEEDLGDDPVKAADYGISNLKYILAHLNEWIPDSEDPDGTHRAELYENLCKQYDRYIRAVQMNIGGIYLTEVKAGTPGKTVESVPRARQKESLLWMIRQIKTCDWIHAPEVTENFPLRLSTVPIFRYLTSYDLMRTYTNVLLSAHVSDDPYTPDEYFDDLFAGVWESAIKGRPVTEADRWLQFHFVDMASTAATAGSTIKRVGALAFAPSVNDIRAFGLDESGFVERHIDYLRELEEENGRGYVAMQMAADRRFGAPGYDWQPRVNLRFIDNSKTLLYGQVTRALTLLRSHVGSATGATKTHYRMLITMIENSLENK